MPNCHRASKGHPNSIKSPALWTASSFGLKLHTRDVTRNVQPAVEASQVITACSRGVTGDHRVRERSHR